MIYVIERAHHSEIIESIDGTARLATRHSPARDRSLSAVREPLVWCSDAFMSAVSPVALMGESNLLSSVDAPPPHEAQQPVGQTLFRVNTR